VARSRGFTTVLGQIDPGPEHFRIARRAADERPQYGPAPEPPPARYVEAWQLECRQADWIVVNSEWSRDLLERAGVPAAKLRVVPLVYEPPAAPPAGERDYPDRFTRARPLRVLFVGQVSVTKGAAALLEALALLADVPFELQMVGAISMDVPRDLARHDAVRWIGPVSRSDVMQHYRDADVLVFPSLSDGFGMAQIEAQAWQLPIIASRSCGRVVCDGVNGLLLDAPTPTAIADAIRRVAVDSTLLRQFSRAATARAGGVPELASALLQLEPA
jgi:glycosyltransferase involved in cell wall biosynthesis